MEFLSPKNFLILQALLIAVGAFYLRRRVPREGIRLRLRRPRTEGSPTVEVKVKDTARPRPTPPSGERALNVHFNFNGHSWDAYEVFGLPAGSSLEKVREAHIKSTTNASDASKEFFNLALQALEQHLQKP